MFGPRNEKCIWRIRKTTKITFYNRIQYKRWKGRPRLIRIDNVQNDPKHDGIGNS